MDKAYEKRIKDSSGERSIENLKNNNAYYTFGEGNYAKFLDTISVSEDKIEVKVFISETYTYHEPGKSPEPSKQGPNYNYRVLLAQDNGVWKISDLEEIPDIRPDLNTQ